MSCLKPVTDLTNHQKGGGTFVCWLGAGLVASVREWGPSSAPALLHCCLLAQNPFLGPHPHLPLTPDFTCSFLAVPGPLLLREACGRISPTFPSPLDTLGGHRPPSQLGLTLGWKPEPAQQRSKDRRLDTQDVLILKTFLSTLWPAQTRPRIDKEGLGEDTRPFGQLCN